MPQEYSEGALMTPVNRGSSPQYRGPYIITLTMCGEGLLAIAQSFHPPLILKELTSNISSLSSES